MSTAWDLQYKYKSIYYYSDKVKNQKGMIGGVDPVFGSRPGDAAVSIVLASVTLVVIFALRSRVDTQHEAVTASSVCYLLLCGAVYLVPRYVFDAFASGVFAVSYLLWISVTVVPLLAIQAGTPVYLFTTRGNTGAMVGLFVGTTYTFWEFLGIRGDIDILAVYPVVIFPLSLTIILVASLVDATARSVARRVGV